MFDRIARILRKQRIPCFILVYQNLDIIRRSIEALAGYTDRLDLQIIENPSDRSDVIREQLDDYLRTGLVSRCFLFDENISNNAFEVILRRELDYARHAHVLVTDGDLLPLEDGWLDEEQTVLRRHPEVFCIGGTLDMANLPLQTFPDAGDWIPADRADHGDYVEAFTGAYFLMFRGVQLGALMAYLDEQDQRFRDGVIAGYCYDRLGLRWARTRRARFVHLTWDLYQDAEHPYTRFKRDVPFAVHWDHGRYASYVCREFRLGRFRERRVRLS